MLGQYYHQHHTHNLFVFVDLVPKKYKIFTLIFTHKIKRRKKHVYLSKKINILNKLFESPTAFGENIKEKFHLFALS